MTRPKSFAVFTLTMTLLVAIGASAQEHFKLKQLVRTGDAAPVPSELLLLSRFGLSNSGQVAFLADGGLVLESAGVTTVVAGFGDPGPGGGIFTRVIAAAIDSQANIVFRGQVTPPSTSGLFL